LSVTELNVVPANNYREGNYAPVTVETTALALPVQGAIPEELDGRLVRIGPNPLVQPDAPDYDWWAAPGMVHGIRLRDGRAEWYRNRYVGGDDVDAQLGRPRTPGPRHGEGGDSPNTNVIEHAGRTLALIEGGALPVELNDELDTVGRYDFAGQLKGGFTGHPKRDPRTGDLHGVSYYWAWEFLRHTSFAPDGTIIRQVDVPISDGPMVHDMALTEKHAILLDLQVTFSLDGVDPAALAAGRALPYRWNPAHTPRVGVLPLQGTADDVIWVELPEARWVFHVLNAYDHDTTAVIVDVIAWDAAFTGTPFGDGDPVLERWVIDLTAHRMQRRVIDDTPCEFPRHDERLTGRPHRYGYTIAYDDPLTGRIRKTDLTTGSETLFDPGPRQSAMEAVFVPANATSAEDDGWLLAYLHDATTDRGSVVVLHAQDLDSGPIATVELPARVPFGYHCNWLASQ
jgi:carotenoid cleavage dioxygenase